MSTWLVIIWAVVALATEPDKTEEDVISEATEDEAPPSGDVREALDALRVVVEAQAERLSNQQAELDSQREMLDAQGAQLRKQTLETLANDDLTFDLDGYYRARAHLFTGLFDEQEGAATYMLHRLRLRTNIRYRELASFHFDIQALDNVVWGDNQSQASTALFAGDASTTGLDGVEKPSFELFRAWTEFSVPLGKLRIGRQPSHWGMGLLANDGDGFRNDFGEANRGNSFDRILFATNPAAIGMTLAKSQATPPPIFLAVGVDRLVEDPLIQFYGYKCTSGVLAEEEDYDVRCDTDGDGVTDLDHSYTQDRDDDQRNPSWWADADDDVYEVLYVLIYRGEDIDLFGATGDLTAGSYVIHRLQRETESSVVIADVYVYSKFRGLMLEFEGVAIFGGTRAIALPGAYDPSGSVDDPLAKKAGISGYVARVGYERPQWKAMIETGFASGDNNVIDETFSGRPLSPDHNVGLLLYEEILARVTSVLWTPEADGLWSRGGVYNSYYLNPRFYWFPLENWEVIGSFVAAWPHQPDGRFILCSEGDGVECAQYGATSPIIGWEADVAIKHRFHEHLLFSLEAGYAKATDRIPLASAGLNPEGNFFTLQSRLAYEF